MSDKFTVDGEFKAGLDFSADEVEAILRHRLLELLVSDDIDAGEKRELARIRGGRRCAAQELAFAYKDSSVQSPAVVFSTFSLVVKCLKLQGKEGIFTL